MGRFGLARVFPCNPRAVELDRVGGVEDSMFHSNTERLIEYWRARKVDRLSPPRAAIDPGDFTDLLPQVFILGRTAPAQYLFRLVGGLVADLHQRDLRRADFLSVWGKSDQPRLAAALEAGRRAGEPVVVMAEAQTDQGLTYRIEVLFAPLRADNLPPDRCLGLYQPIAPVSQLRGQRVEALGIVRFNTADHRESFPPLRLAAVDGRLIA